MYRRQFLRAGVVGVGASTVATGTSRGQEDDPNPRVVSRFAPPKANANGITYDGESLWIGHSKDNGDLIYETGTGGRIRSSFSFPGDDTTPDIYGVAAMNDSLYAFGDEFILYESRQPVMYELSKDGERLNRYETSGNFGYNAVAGDGTHLFVSKPGEEIVRVLTTAANQYRSVAVSSGFGGLCYDGEAFWGTARDKIYQFSPDGTVKRRLSYPGDHGIGVAHDGRYLYMVDENGDRIYKLDPDVGGSVSSGPGGGGTPTDGGAGGQQTGDTQTATNLRDSDGDGVPDSEDYAPRDPSVQDESDLQQDSSDGFGPGFGPASTVAALGWAAVYLVKQRATDE